MASIPNSKDKKKSINHSMLLCCKVYISESRNQTALDAIERAARLNPETAIVNKFPDGVYNRVNFTLVSYVIHDSTGNPIFSPLVQTVVDMAEAAYQAIDLQLQSGTHPRLGVVDDILINPLARSSLDEAAWLAKTVAKEIGNRFQGNLPNLKFCLVNIFHKPNPQLVTVPVFLYNAAHPTGQALDTIRRRLGYYRPNSMGHQWAGWDQPEILSEVPDEGPRQVSRSRGISMIGARPWVAFYNVPIMSTDISAARRIAKRASGRGGGLPTVQTLGLAHGEESTEIACMLLEPNRVGADRVQNWVEMLASQEGLDVEKGYFTDISQEMLVEKYLHLVSIDREL